jgi:hypothetical protein
MRCLGVIVGYVVSSQDHGPVAESAKTCHDNAADCGETRPIVADADSVVEAIEPLDGGDPVGCRAMGGNPEQLAGASPEGLARNESNAGQNLDPVETN